MDPTRAEQEKDDWVINGTKTFISNAGTDISDGLVLMAATGEKPTGKKAISSFCIPQDTPGFKLGQSWDKMAWFGMDNRELVFEDCRVPLGDDHERSRLTQSSRRNFQVNYSGSL